jgi:peptide/nickel transport system permease protein
MRYVARRMLYSGPVLFGVSLIVFFLVHVVPGDPVQAMMGFHATPEAVAQLRAYYGLDRPLPEQYLTFLYHAVQLDFGESIQLHTPVASLVGSRLPTTLLLVFYSVVVALVIAVPLGIYSGIRANKLADQGIRILMTITFVMPAFWLGLVLIMVFSLTLHLFPAAGIRQGLLPTIWSLTLPAVTLALYLAPVLIRSLRASMIESLRADHVVAARARGLPETLILRRQVLRLSLLPLVTLVALNIGFLLSGAVVVERVFAIPGIGGLLIDAVGARDFPVIVPVALILAVGFIVANLVADLTNALLDPRIQL